MITTSVPTLLCPFFTQTFDFRDAISLFAALAELDVSLYGYYTQYVRHTFFDKCMFATLHAEMSSSKKKPIAAFVNARQRIVERCLAKPVALVWWLDGEKCNSVEAQVPSTHVVMCIACF